MTSLPVRRWPGYGGPRQVHTCDLASIAWSPLAKSQFAQGIRTLRRDVRRSVPKSQAQQGLHARRECWKRLILRGVLCRGATSCFRMRADCHGYRAILGVAGRRRVGDGEVTRVWWQIPMKLKRVARSVTPPVVVTGWKRLTRRIADAPGSPPEWEYVPEGWTRARTDPSVTGWDVATVREAYQEKLACSGKGWRARALATGTTPSAMTRPPNLDDQNLVLAYAYTITLAARMRSSVSVLDWGGGVALFSLLGKALLPSDVALEYHCKELPLVCDLGRAEMPDVKFHADDTCLDRTYDLVLASSSLQYAEAWHELFDRLATATRGYLYLARVPVVFASPSFVALQRAYEHGLGTEYLSWVFSRDEILDRADRAGLDLVREFLQGYKPLVHGAPEQDETRGFLFRPRARS